MSPRTACSLHSDEGELGKHRLLRRMESCSRDLGEKIGLRSVRSRKNPQRVLGDVHTVA